MKTKPTVPPHVRDALNHILSYLWDDERKDYCGRDDWQGHLFTSLLEVSLWLADEIPVGLFSLGNIFVTPGAFEALDDAGHGPGDFLARHVQGDWGELDEHDREANHRAVTDGTRLLSSYRTRSGITLWVITEADRSATTILLPGEY